MNDQIADALDAFVPAFDSVNGDWDAVITAASAAGDALVIPRSNSHFQRVWFGRRWPKRLLVVGVAAVALAGAGVGIAAGLGAFSDGWNSRCAQMPAEAAVPKGLQATVHKSFPWVPDAGAIHVGPVWIFALSSHTNISRDADDSDGQHRYLHRTLVAVAPSYTRKVSITGRRLGEQGPRTKLGFTRGTTTCHIFGKTWCARSRWTRSRAWSCPPARDGGRFARRSRSGGPAASL